jgi:hypothetical protein
MLDQLDELRNVSVERALDALGLRRMDRNSWGPCPACGAEQRGRTDKRGPLGVAVGWKCWACGRTGGVPELCAHVVMQRGGPRAGGRGWPAVLALAAEVGLFLPDGPSAGSGRAGAPVARPAPVAPAGAVSAGDRGPPPAVEVRELWGRCVSVLEARGAPLAFLEGRKWRPEDVERLAGMDLARALPVNVRTPEWAAYGRVSWAGGWRLILPCYGPGGELVQLRARWVENKQRPPNAPKEHGGTGITHGGCVFADPMGRRLLAGDAEGLELVLVAEGWPDFARFAARAPGGAAVLGVWSGAWSSALAACIPDGARVILATDPNRAGDEYAAKILASLGGRCRVDRWLADYRGLPPVVGSDGKPLPPDADNVARAGVDLWADVSEHAVPFGVAPEEEPVLEEDEWGAPAEDLRLPWRTVGEWGSLQGIEWLHDEPPPRSWLLTDHKCEQAGGKVLSRGIVGIFASAGGVGKTFALLELALLVAMGPTSKHYRRWLDVLSVDGGRVLFVAGEESADELQRRLWAVAQRVGLERGSDLGNLARDRLVVVPTLGVANLALLTVEPDGNMRPSARHREIVERLEEGEEPWDLVIVDPMIRFAAGELDRDNMAAAALIASFEGFVKAGARPGHPGPAVLVAHHTSKQARNNPGPSSDGASKVRGASAITDNARWAALLEVDPETPGRIVLTVDKSNYGAKPSYELARDERGMLRGAVELDKELWDRLRHALKMLEGKRQAMDKAAMSEGAKLVKSTAMPTDPKPTTSTDPRPK